MLPRISATAYLTPLREGGSLPGLVEADDDGIYVVKFIGAGQGPKALVAEVVVGELLDPWGFGRRISRSSTSTRKSGGENQTRRSKNWSWPAQG